MVLLVLVAAIYYLLASRQATKAAVWRVETSTHDDGTLVVSVDGPRGQRRVVRELPPGMDSIDMTSELRLAREDAQLQADELNRRG